MAEKQEEIEVPKDTLETPKRGAMARGDESPAPANVDAPASAAATVEASEQPIDNEVATESTTDEDLLKSLRYSLEKRSDELVEKSRRIMFSDAAVAIALTLLILPLMESAIEAREEEGITVLKWFQDNRDLLLSFCLSYMVVAMAWIDHDRLFRTVSHFNGMLHFLNFLWLMAIAFIPVAASIMNSVADDPLQHFVWIGTFLFAKCVVLTMTLVVHKNPDLWHKIGPQFSQVIASTVSIVLLLIALFCSMTAAGYLMLLILILRVPITRAILYARPSLEQKWAVDDKNKNGRPTVSDKLETLMEHGRTNDSKGGSTTLSSPQFKEAISFIVEFKDRIDGLMDAERRINFTDAAAAIALTLLVLPLMDAATDARGSEISTADWFRENRYLMLSFFLSYLVILQCWTSQDRLFRNVGAFTRALTSLNFFWLLAIVFVPVATALINLPVENDVLQHVVYIGTPLLATIWTLCMVVEVHRNPGTWEKKGGPTFPLLLSNIVSLVLHVIALLLSMTVVGYLGLLILVLKRPIVKLLLWKWPSLKTKW